MRDHYQRVIVSAFGGVEVLKTEYVPIPTPKAGEVRLQVIATGVSFADLLMREGLHPEVWFERPPFTLGWEVIGVIDAIGIGVQGFAVGQRVAALTVKGGYSEMICLPAARLIPVDDDLDPLAVICLIYNYVVAYQMLHRAAKVKAGDTILIHSAAGGVGSALVELGRLADLTLYGTASVSKHADLTAAGCTPIDYKSVDFVQQIRDLTHGAGVCAVFDGIGGTHLQRSYQALGRGGRLIAYGLSATIAPSQARRGRTPVILSALGQWLRAFALNLIPDGRSLQLYSIQTLQRQRPDWYREDVQALLRHLRNGRLRPKVMLTLPLTEAAEAHRLLATGQSIGKLILTMR
ncbi:MAG: medium chain dehydrogenase/reductase family protein [Anaerolineae bacterium]|jgi:NADPH2:quinone reductase|nr:medium chain dehydrogenase/reductase family protein [Anaerolineae bacterium]